MLGSAAGLASREGAPGAFFNGVLATALATPCTAPFLSVALGFAFAQPPAIILLTFSSVAAGLAAPYLILSYQPRWLSFLPKPGTWMLRFKVAMGFPMLATAVWLFDLTAPTFGESATLWLGLLLVVLAITAWVWGEFVQKGSTRKGLAMGFCLLLVAFDYGYVLENELHWRSPAGKKKFSTIIQDYPDGVEWHVWSAEAVREARSSGKPVLVDFTARWCLTCKSNKKFAVEVPSVRAKLKEIGAVVFRADNTDPDPAIAEELKRYERAGVPLVLVFPREADRSAVVLPAILTSSIVLDALTAAAR